MLGVKYTYVMLLLATQRYKKKMQHMVYNESEAFDKALTNGGLTYSAEVTNDIFIILIVRLRFY